MGAVQSLFSRNRPHDSCFWHATLICFTLPEALCYSLSSHALSLSPSLRLLSIFLPSLFSSTSSCFLSWPLFFPLFHPFLFHPAIILCVNIWTSFQTRVMERDTVIDLGMLGFVPSQPSYFYHTHTHTHFPSCLFLLSVKPYPFCCVPLCASNISVLSLTAMNVKASARLSRKTPPNRLQTRWMLLMLM